jgi:hypothetical protein
MASEGPNSPSAAENAGSGDDWSDPVNILASDGMSASISGNVFTPVTSKRLRASGFGFSLPAGATVNGVAASVECSGNSGTSNASAQLVADGASAGDAKEFALPSPESAATLGGAADAWGATLTAAQVNAADFGLDLYVSGFVDTGHVDYVSLTVHYTAAQQPCVIEIYARILLPPCLFGGVQ